MPIKPAPCPMCPLPASHAMSAGATGSNTTQPAAADSRKRDTPAAARNAAAAGGRAASTWRSCPRGTPAGQAPHGSPAPGCPEGGCTEAAQGASSNPHGFRATGLAGSCLCPARAAGQAEEAAATGNQRTLHAAAKPPLSEQNAQEQQVPPQQELVQQHAVGVTFTAEEQRLLLTKPAQQT